MKLDEIEELVEDFDALRGNCSPAYIIAQCRVRKLVAVAKLALADNFGVLMIEALKDLES